MIESHGEEKNFDGIGVGAPNANYYTGTIEQAPNFRGKELFPLQN
jgi:glucokinase